MTIEERELMRRIAEVEAWARGSGISGLRSQDLWPAELLGPRTDASPPGDLLQLLLDDAAMARDERIAERRRGSCRRRGSSSVRPRPEGGFSART
jgi:hypothetical protein